MRRTLASWAALLGVVAFACLPLSALAQRRGGVPFGLNWNRGRPATSALLSMALTGDCEGTTPSGLTFTRTSTATCTRSDGILTTVASGAPRLEASGLLVEGAATNAVLHSAAMDNAAWAKMAGLSVTADASIAPDGTMTADTLTKTGSTTALAFQATTLTATGNYTASAHTSGSTYSTVVLNCDGGSTASCTCATSTGAACTTGTSSTECYAYAAATGAPLRLSARASCTTPVTGVSMSVTPGRYLVDADAQSVFWGAQLEVGPVATSYIPTAGTQVTRAGEVYSVPTPAGLSTLEGCMRVVMTPIFTGPNPTGNSLVWAAPTGAAQLLLYSTTGSLNVNAVAGPLVLTAHGFTSGQQRAFRTEWSASGPFLRIVREDTGTFASSATFSGWTSLGPTIGSHSTVNAPMSRISSLQLGRTAGACQ